MTRDIELIYTKLRDEIITLKLKPGQPLKEVALAQQFRVSRTPIRDVFKKLEYDQLLTVKSQCGSYVSKINLEGVNDIMYIRSRVETAVCLEAQQVLTPGDATRLRLLIKEQENAISIEDQDDRARLFFELDNNFHFQIYSLVGKDGALRLLNDSFPFFSRFRYLTYYRHVDELYNLVRYHCDILRMLEDKDREGLTKAVQDHNFSGIDGIEAINDEHPEYFD